MNSMTIDVNKKDNLADIRLDNYVVKLFKFGTMQHIFDTKPGATQIWREIEVFKKFVA